MRQTIIVALLLSSGLAFAGETNDTSVTLSGHLHLGKPMSHLNPYYLDVTIVGGGTQQVCLKGKTIEQFKEQIKRSRYKHIPVRVTGHFKTEYMGTAQKWSPQPTMPGWMIWLEVESVTGEELRSPLVIKEGANKPFQDSVVPPHPER